MLRAAEQHTVLSNIAVVLCQALEDRGLDGRAALGEAGIDYADAANPDTRITLKQHQALWHLAVEHTGEPCLGLIVGQAFPPAALHGLGLGWMASTTLKAAFDRLIRYQRVLSTNAELEWQESGNSYRFVGRTKTADPDFESAAADATLAVVVRLCRITLSESVRPVKVCVQHDRRVCEGHYRKFYGCEVTFDAPDYSLEFDKAVLAQALPGANPLLARINDQAVADYLARFDQQDTTTRVRQHLIEALVDGRPDQASIARALNLSLRQLQRELGSQGTSFRQLTEEVRRGLAVSYLRERHKSIGEISWLLGYTEPANFSRSFKKWTGQTPKTFREAS
jgi:AraC-like DNA-binding protein